MVSLRRIMHDTIVIIYCKHTWWHMTSLTKLPEQITFTFTKLPLHERNEHNEFSSLVKQLRNERKRSLDWNHENGLTNGDRGRQSEVYKKIL